VPELIPYASRTGTRRNLDALREAGWRLLVSASGVLRHEGFRYCFDNSAWTHYQEGTPFDDDRYHGALVKMGPDADFSIVPDIVAGGMDSLRFSLRWLPRVLEHTKIALIPVQDGMERGDVSLWFEKLLLGPRVGIFVGGSPATDFKERTTPFWASMARRAGAWCHVGRVNTQRRIAICAAAGATSFDGSSASKFAKSLPVLQRALVQQSLVFEHPPTDKDD
jgi:hypothetical protein